MITSKAGQQTPNEVKRSRLNSGPHSLMPGWLGHRGHRSFVSSISKTNLLLLKAALLDGDSAIAAYEEWCETLDLDSLPPGQYRLLPLLQSNMSRLGISDPLMDQFRGIRRFFWVRNLKAMSLAQQVFAALNQAGVPFIVLKGAALVACYLDDRSLRPMDDIDILVSEKWLSDAIALLTELKFRPKGNVTSRNLIESGRLRSTLPGWAFHTPSQAIDLHWKAMHLDLSPHADDNFWKARREVSLDGTKIAVLSPADQLLHTFSHAAQIAAAGALDRWPADATMIIRGAKDLSFERLLAEAGRRKLSALAAEGCALLADELKLPISETVTYQLRTAASWLERREMRLLAEASSRGHHTDAPLILALQDFRRSRTDIVNTGHLVLEFLKAWTGCESAGLALFIGLQSVLGWPGWLRQMLGRDCYRTDPVLDRLPRVDDTVDLARTDEAALITGWSFPEPHGRWTIGREATVAWDIRGEEQDLTVRIDGFALLHEKAPVRRIELWVNDSRVASWRFMNSESPLPARILIPRQLVQNRNVLMLTFLIRNPVSPAAIDMSLDPRALGVFLRSLELRRALDPDRLPKVGDTLNLASPPDTALIAGWSHPEPGGRWTMGGEATVAWDIRGEEKDLAVQVDGSALLHEKAPVRKIELWANDSRVASWRFTDSESPLPARILIPRKLIRNHEVLMLTFRIRNPVSPAAIDISLDSRALGLYLRSLELMGAS